MPKNTKKEQRELRRKQRRATKELLRVAAEQSERATRLVEDVLQPTGNTKRFNGSGSSWALAALERGAARRRAKK